MRSKRGSSSRARRYEIDQRIRGYGRLRLATGSRTAAEHAVRKAIVVKLVRAGELDTILAVKRGELSWLDLLRGGERDKRAVKRA